MDTALSTRPTVVRVCLLACAAIAISGGSLQRVLGQPDTTPRRHNIRRLSMSKVGLPEPAALWLGYLGSERVVPVVLAAAQYHRP
jgi:hypothetical protein